MAFFETERYDLALADFKKAAGLYPDKADNWNSLGVALFLTGSREQALLSFSKALELDPALANVYDNRSRALKALGRSGAAARDLETAKALAAGPGRALKFEGVSLADFTELDRKKGAAIRFP
jgi:tetratricopeptide (TPR) repeat protein